MNLRASFLNSNSFTSENNVFYQRNFDRFRGFEEVYMSLRKKERRNYDDHVLAHLPEISGDHVHHPEWNSRQASFDYLISILNNEKNANYLLEVGCGNGWLSQRIATKLNIQVCALDLNETELIQGGRVFSNNQNVSFVYGDIFNLNFPVRFDVIVLASSIQYFEDLDLLINRLLELVSPAGSIFILDSPLYSSVSKKNEARNRSQVYFQSMGFPAMHEQYYHHTLDELEKFDFQILFNSRSAKTYLQRKLLQRKLPSFPILRIKRP